MNLSFIEETVHSNSMAKEFKFWKSITIQDSIDFILTSEELSFSNAQQIRRTGFIEDDFFFGSATPLLTPLIPYILNGEKALIMKLRMIMNKNSFNSGIVIVTFFPQFIE